MASNASGSIHRTDRPIPPAPAGTRGRTLGCVAAPVLTYRGDFFFDLSPEQLWHRIESVDQFETWWPWLTEFRAEGGGLNEGTVLHGTVSPPLPYRMRVRIVLGRCRSPVSIDATIDGDLVGDAHLQFRPDGDGTRADVAWALEMRQPAMRLACRFGRPLLQWGHDRVVQMTVAEFRRRIEVPRGKT